MKLVDALKYFYIEEPKKILLVDDNRLILDIEKAVLIKKGFTIFTATKGKEALKIHEKEKVDLILLDLYLPDIKGDEVCRRIRADNRLKDVSIIMVTASSKPMDVEICKLSGANDYITKPITPDNIATKLLPKMYKLLTIRPRKDMKVQIKLKKKNKTPRSRLFGNTINISMTGMLIETHVPLDVNEPVPLIFRVPKRDEYFELKGGVIREDKETSRGVYRYGLKFLNVGWKERKLLKELVEQ